MTLITYGGRLKRYDMSTPILLNDLYEIKVGCYCTNQAGINVTHWKCTAVTGTGSFDTSFAIAVDTGINGYMKSMLPSVATYYGVRAQKISPLPKSVAVVTSANTGIGTGGLSPLPTQVSGIFTITTGLAGRAGRGRQYIPFPAAAFNDNTLDTPTAAYKTILTNVAIGQTTNYVVGTGGNTVTMSPVLFHRALGTTTPITGYVARQAWATQRKRGNYGRTNVYPPF